MTYNPFQWQVLGLLTMLVAQSTDSQLLRILWTLFAIYCFVCAILERRRPR